MQRKTSELVIQSGYHRPESATFLTFVKNNVNYKNVTAKNENHYKKEGETRLKKTIQNRNDQNFRSHMKKAAHSYWMAIGLTLACLIIVLVLEEVSPQTYVRYFFGSLLVLWLPGYGLTKILFPKMPSAAENRVDLGLRAALSVVLSIALVSIVGAVLNFTPWGVQLYTLVFSLSVLTVFLLTIAVFREYIIQRNVP